jgi:hypothetical protein
MAAEGASVWRSERSTTPLSLRAPTLADRTRPLKSARVGRVPALRHALGRILCRRAPCAA